MSVAPFAGEVVGSSLAVTGNLTSDPQLPLTEVVANLYQGEELIYTVPLLNLDSWQQTPPSSYSVSIPLSQYLEPGLYAVELEVADAARTAVSARQPFRYRFFNAPTIAVEPLPQPTLIGNVTVAGNVTWDSSLGDQGVRQVRADLFFAAVDATPEAQFTAPVVGSEFTFTATGEAFAADGEYHLVLNAVDVTGAPAVPVTVSFEHLQSDEALHMPMDRQSDGLLPDVAGFANVGLLSGSLENRFAPGAIGNALKFSADFADETFTTVADHAEVDLGTSDFSIFAWVNTTKNTQLQSILEKRAFSTADVPGYTLYLSAAGSPALQMVSVVETGAIAWQNFESSPASDGAAANDGEWHHVGVTVARNQAEGGLKLYVDGKQVGAHDPTRFAASLNNDEALLIGRHINWSDGHFVGNLDEVLVVKRALNDTEIQELHADGAFPAIRLETPVLTAGEPLEVFEVLAIAGDIQLQSGSPVRAFTLSVLQDGQVLREIDLGDVLDEVGGEFKYEFSFGDVDDGDYLLRLDVSDARGRTDQTDIPVRFARMRAPTLNLIANPKGDESRLGGSYTAGYSIDSRIESITLTGRINYADGTFAAIPMQLDSPLPPSDGVVFAIADEQVKPGRNEIVVTLDDGYNPAVTARTEINFAVPVVTITAPLNNATVTGNSVDVRFQVQYSGPNTNPARLPNSLVLLNGVLQANKTVSGTPATGVFQYSFSANELAAANNRVEIRVADYRDVTAVGSNTVSFTYSRTTLSLTVTEPALDSTRIYTGDVRFSYTSSSPLASAVYLINGQEDAIVELANASSPYSYTIVAEDDLRAGQNTITIRATGANGATAEATRVFTYAIPAIANMKMSSADGNTLTTLMGDVTLTFSSNVQLAAGQVFVNNEPVQDLVLNDASAPFEYRATLPGAAFISGQNLVQVDCIDTNKVPVSGSANANYLSTRVDGAFDFLIGIGRGIIISSTVQGVLSRTVGVPNGVNLTALYINDKRSSFSSAIRNATGFHYSIRLTDIDEALGNASAAALNLTGYMGGGGVTYSGTSVIAAYRYPGGRFPNTTEQRTVTHVSVDGHGQMAATSTGANNFAATGGGNQTMIGGSRANDYFFDASSGADEITVNAQAAANGSGSTVFNYSDVSLQSLSFYRIQSTGDLLIANGTGFPNPFSWQLVKSYFSMERAINRIDHLDGQGFMPAAGNIPQYEWTAWGSRDIPDANGDFETISDWKAEGRMPVSCEPVAVQARLLGTTAPILWPGDINQDPGVESFDVKAGYACRNGATSTCADYEVRFLCPFQTVVR